MSISDVEKELVRARNEAIHKTWRSNGTTFKAAEREAGKFILGMVKDTWVRDLKQAKNLLYLQRGENAHPPTSVMQGTP